MKTLKKKVRSAKHVFHNTFFRPKKRLLKQVEFRGASFLVLANEDIGSRLLSFKEYERNEITTLERLVRKDDVCVDVGANIGIHTIFMARKAHERQTIAFEPVPFNRNVLAVNIGLNEIVNIQVHDCVLSDSVGTVEFSVSEDAAYSSLRPTKVKREASSLSARSDTLDNLFAKMRQKVDVIKIDVEGAELLVLKGGEQLLTTPELRPRALLVELCSQHQSTYGYGAEDVISYMETLGYNVYSVTDKGAEKGWSLNGAVNALFLHSDDSNNPRMSV
jgi:FkbM family methyltransferase